MPNVQAWNIITNYYKMIINYRCYLFKNKEKNSYRTRKSKAEYFNHTKTPCSIWCKIILRRAIKFYIYIYTSIAHRSKNPLRRTSENIAIIYFQTFPEHIIRMVYRVNYERSFSALREDAVGALASLTITRIYALIQFLLTHNYSRTWIQFISS